MTESSNQPLFGLWQPRPLQALYYGPDCVKNHLLSCLPSKSSKAFILTGSSLANKTSLIKDVESLLGDRHAKTFSNIKQHAPVADLDKATELVLGDDSIDTIISIGGGSPIDSGKAISYRAHEKGGQWLHHITIPTTLSAAECTHMAGYTNEDGVKTGIGAKEVAVNAIFYDPKFGAQTPSKLWLGTGCRALDHAIETLYNPTATEIAKVACLQAASSLFQLLPQARQSHGKDDDLTTKLFLAAYSSLGFIGLNMKGGLGLSHALGYALGSPYQM
jgi:alcohol dehydrogenase class IV